MPAAPYVVRTGAESRSASARTASPASRAPPPAQMSGRRAPSIAAIGGGKIGRLVRGVKAEHRGRRRTSAAEQVGRDLQVRGAGRRLDRRAHRGLDRRLHRVGRVRDVHGLHDRREHRRLTVGLVQDAAVLAGPAQAARDVGGDHEDRRP